MDQTCFDCDGTEAGIVRHSRFRIYLVGSARSDWRGGDWVFGWHAFYYDNTQSFDLSANEKGVK